MKIFSADQTEGVLKLSLSKADNDRFEETFGTNSADFAMTLLKQITNVVPSGAPDVNAVLAAMNGMAPQTELQAMLAAQMVGAHTLAMEFQRRTNVHLVRGNPDLAERYFNLATKASRTFAAQVETLGRSQGGSKQTVEVKHIHVNAQNAIVGDISHG